MTLPDMSASPIIEARNVSKYFGAVTALENVNLKLFRGEVLGVVGDNGAGKSTLMKILAGLYPPSAGEIFVEGVPVRFHGFFPGCEIGHADGPQRRPRPRHRDGLSGPGAGGQHAH